MKFVLLFMLSLSVNAAEYDVETIKNVLPCVFKYKVHGTVDWKHGFTGVCEERFIITKIKDLEQDEAPLIISYE